VRAFPVVLSLWLLKIYISHPSLVPFCNPNNKTETGRANRWGTTNSKPPGSIIMMGQSETWAVVRSYLLHSFLLVHSAATPFTSHGNVRTYAEPKPFSWAKPEMLLSQYINCWKLHHEGDTLIGLTHLRHAEIGVEASTLCPQTTCVGPKVHQFYVPWPQ
jgi:hypothetical protein